MILKFESDPEHGFEILNCQVSSGSIQNIS